MATSRELTIGNLRYVVDRKRWGIEEQDVLEIYRLDVKYLWPTWQIPRSDTAYMHIWALFEEVERTRPTSFAQYCHATIEDSFDNVMFCGLLKGHEGPHYP